MIVEPLQKADEKTWDSFVSDSREGTLFHLTGWKSLVEKVCRHEALYLTAKEGGEWKGVLPLFLVKHPWAGRRLVSVPYAVLGSVCTDSPEAEKALLDRAVGLALEKGASYLELRDMRERTGPFRTDRQYVTFHLDLAHEPDRILSEMRKSHRRVLKSFNSGLTLDLDDRDIDSFYRFYASDQHRFGTPVQGYAWIKGIFETFPEWHSLAKVVFEGKTIAYFMVRRYKGVVSEVLGNDLREYRHLHPNPFMEWGLIQDACRKGYRIYDFGRSLTDSGPYHFKEGWGARAVPLCYHFYLNGRTDIPDTSQKSGSRRRFSAVWRRLPLPVASWLGPKIRRLYP